jgi:hypothetical protein
MKARRNLIQIWLLCAAMLPTVVQAQFTFITNNGTITITRYTGTGAEVAIPSATNGLPVTSIGTGAFFEVFGLTSVTIPNSVTTIGIQAFFACPSLTNVTIGNSVTSIGNAAFDWCGSLVSVTIPNSVTSIGTNAFSFCTSLTNVTIGNSVTSIEDEAFRQCTNLTSVTIPNSVTSIGNWVFEACLKLTKVYFSGNAPNGNLTSLTGNSWSGTAYYLPGTTGWSSSFALWPTALWYQPNPTILGSGYGLGTTTNGFGFTISWATNISVVVEACADLADANWCPVATNALVAGTNYFSDPNWTDYPVRFYRIRSVP